VTFDTTGFGQAWNVAVSYFYYFAYKYSCTKIFDLFTTLVCFWEILLVITDGS